MNDPLKSAWELALEKLRDRNDEQGDRPELSDEQKQRISAVRENFAARRAELRFRHERELEEMGGGPEVDEHLVQVRADYDARLAQLEEEEREAVRKIRAGVPAADPGAEEGCEPGRTMA